MFLLTSVNVVMFIIINVSDFIYKCQLVHLTIFAVNSLHHQIRFECVLHVLSAEMVQVLLLDEFTLFFLQRQPGTVNEPQASHHWDVILFCDMVKIIHKTRVVNPETSLWVMNKLHSNCLYLLFFYADLLHSNTICTTIFWEVRAFKD